MTNPRTGEIWLINWSKSRGSEQSGIRPSIILQSDKGNLNDKYPNTILNSNLRKNMDKLPRLKSRGFQAKL